jgi:type IV pilus assembly protein PilV
MTQMRHNSSSNERGFTLLEVLIALLILSIGLLGLAALQTVGLRSNQMAVLRTQATHQAYDMTDRMRANPVATDASEYVISIDQAPGDTAATGQALQDLVDWRGMVETLPGGKSSISRCIPPGAAPNLCTAITNTATVFWDEERKGVTGTNCGPDPDIDLRCIILTM